MGRCACGCLQREKRQQLAGRKRDEMMIYREHKIARSESFRDCDRVLRKRM